MRIVRIKRRAALAMLSVTLVAATGCWPVALPLLSRLSPTENQRIVGGNAQRLVISQTTGLRASLLAPDVAQPGPDTTRTRFVSVDLNSLAVEPLFEVNGTAYFAVSDGRWLAWTSVSENALQTLMVRDLQNGTQSRLFEDQAETSWFILIALDAGRLVASLRNPPDSRESLIVVMDLVSGEQTTIGPVEIGYALSTVAISGDRLVLLVQQPDDPDTQEPNTIPTGHMIDQIDLRTGERSTILSNLGPYSDSLFLIDNRLIWTEFDLDSSSLEVRGYDLRSGRHESLATFEQDQDRTDTMHIEDAGEAGLLVHRSIYPAGFSFAQLLIPPFSVTLTDSYALHAFDGSISTVFETEYRFPDTIPLNVNSVVVEDFIVFRDPVSAEYIVHNIESNKQRRFNPFAQ